MKPKPVLAIAAVLVLLAFPSMKLNTNNDPYLFMEEVRGTSAIAWVEGKNKISEARLLGDPRAAKAEADARKIILSPDRIAMPRLLEGKIYNFWQDANHTRGILRRTTLDSYRTEQPNWELVLDVDALASQENENWVYSGLTCFDAERCMILFSRGGGDATVAREFNLVTKSFRVDGFTLPESKSDVTWLDQDTLFVGDARSPDTQTDSGYAKIIRKWTRGQTLDQAPVIFTGEKTDVAAYAYVAEYHGTRTAMLGRYKTFYTDETSVILPDGSLKKLPKQDSAYVSSVFAHEVVIALRDDWTVNGQTFKAGSLVSIPLANLDATPKTIFAPSATTAFTEVAYTRNRVYVFGLDNVKGRLTAHDLVRGSWVSEAVTLPGSGTVAGVSSSVKSDVLLINYEDFLTPDSVLEVNENGGRIQASPLKSLPAAFDAQNFEVKQYTSTSKDGAQIPYFVVAKKGLTLDGSNPTLLYGYGGFEVSMLPTYLGTTGKLWLEQGGVYVLANIRGGGEFGPQWHNSAILENRMKVFEDFISVAEKLIADKITSPRRLGIQGGSNGGLLVGGTMVLRPDLFNAVVCQVPLLDMIRYHLLLAGASWMAEYGNPEDPAMRDVILTYSPYQNVSASAKYPKIFFMTSTADDRVHPGHARKMAAKMEEQGHEFLYYENTEGGHGGAANLEQRIKQVTLYTVYLYQQLMD